MRLTAFTDFGLRALMRIAGEPERAFSTSELAAEFGISRNHLTKTVAALANAGILTTRRGAGGGAMLARPPAQIRLGEVVRILERDQALVECFRADGGACVVTPQCRLKGFLSSAEAAFVEALDRHTLADCALAPRRASQKAGS
jgi:Rrf2 family nitric oxide-sensitive transcriptional repressor